MSTQIYTIDLKDSTMDYFRFGNENGRPLIILPGLSLKSVMGSADAVAGAYALMAEDYDVYLLDRIRTFPEGYTVENMAEDTLKAIHELGLSQVNIMGVSQGGMIAQLMALKSPQTVHSLILCSTASRIPKEAADTISKWREYAVNKDIPALSEAFGKNVYTPEFFEMYQEIILHANDGATDEELAKFVKAIDALAAYDVYERLNEITCPVFVIGAGADQVLGVHASTEMMEKLGCEGYIYEGKGHGVYDEAPDYLQRVKSFLDPVQ